MKYLCYTIYDGRVGEDKKGNPLYKEPVGYCTMAEDGSLAGASTLDGLKNSIKLKEPSAEFWDGCGWLLEGESERLLDPMNTPQLRFWLMLREQRMAEEAQKKAEKAAENE